MHGYLIIGTYSDCKWNHTRNEGQWLFFFFYGSNFRLFSAILKSFLPQTTLMMPPTAPSLQAVSGDDAFLARIVVPLYDTIKGRGQCQSERHCPAGRMPAECPLVLSQKFFAPQTSHHRVRKIGFVEQRSFWNPYRSFSLRMTSLNLLFYPKTVSPWASS